MNAFRFRRFAVVAVLGSVLFGAEMALAQQNARPEDILGGVRLLFKPHQNPPVNRRSNQLSSSRKATHDEKNKPLVPAAAKDDLRDEVEDALALGNTARDRKPPDFASAEKAYRLAWKLNPKDARPFVGLGNIYFDQGQFAEAAKAYREAIILGEPRTRTVVGKPPTYSVTRVRPHVSPRNIPEISRSTAEWHVYLAISLLQQQNSSGAELELRNAISGDPQNANWHALLGYDLFTQERFTEASEVYERAVQLEPGNDLYKDLLKQSSLRAKAASARDLEINKRLGNTNWEIVESSAGRTKAHCELKGNGGLRCWSADIRNLRYPYGEWSVEDGLLILYLPNPAGIPCIGRLEQNGLHLRCVLGEVEMKEAWNRIN